MWVGTCCSPAICPLNCREQGPTSNSHILGYQMLYLSEEHNTSFGQKGLPDLQSHEEILQLFPLAVPALFQQPQWVQLVNHQTMHLPVLAVLPKQESRKSSRKGWLCGLRKARSPLHGLSASGFTQRYSGVQRTLTPVKSRGNQFLVCFQMSWPLSRLEISYSIPRAKIHSLGQHSRFCISVKSLLRPACSFTGKFICVSTNEWC